MYSAVMWKLSSSLSLVSPVLLPRFPSLFFSSILTHGPFPLFSVSVSVIVDIPIKKYSKFYVDERYWAATCRKKKPNKTTRIKEISACCTWYSAVANCSVVFRVFSLAVVLPLQVFSCLFLLSCENFAVVFGYMEDQEWDDWGEKNHKFVMLNDWRAFIIWVELR